MIRKIRMIFLYALLLVIFAVSIAALVVFMRWPWWVGLPLAAGFLSVVFGLLFLKKYLLRRRERQFVRQVIDQDVSAIGNAPPHEQRHLKDLQEKWKTSVDLLRQSNLKKLGNPLYVLPWYMVLGESGSGKTTAIRNAKANSPVAEVSAGIAGTRNFDWWFFDEAIVLDTAGRYSVPVDDEPDRQEWERFLTLLARYRKKEPLNGIILTVSADHLLTKSADDLRENGLNLRKRTDQLMRICGAKFPVYLMVTKLDRVHGFNPFSQMIPDDRMNQAMGYSACEPADTWQSFLDTAHRFVCDRLKDLRLLIIQGSSRIDPGALLFPDEFNKLYAGLNAFAQGVFQENPYQETPMFMGIYYSSGKQGEKPCSEFIDHFNIAAAAPANPRNGLFLRDFFKKILPGDRNLFLPIHEYFRWRRITARLGLTAWCLLWICLLGLVSFSYFKNIESIEEIYRTTDSMPVFTGDLSTDLLMLSDYGSRIEQVRQLNRNWLVPRFGFDHSLRVEKQFVDRYIDHFRKHLLLVMDRKLQETIGSFDEDTPDAVLAEYAGHITARMRLLQMSMEGIRHESDAWLSGLSSEILQVVNPDMPRDLIFLFGENYWRYNALDAGRADIEKRFEALHARLIQLLESRNMNLNWIAGKEPPNVSGIRLNDFWKALQNSQQGARYPAVEAAYTRKGRLQVLSFLDRMEHVLGSPPGFVRERNEFLRQYENMYLQAWANFAFNFPEGADLLSTRIKQRSIAREMATEHNPFFTLLSEMAGQLRVLDDLPPWAETIVEIETIRNTRVETEEADKSLMDRIRMRSDQAEQRVGTVTSPEAARIKEARIQAAESWQAFIQILQNIEPVGRSPEAAFDMAGGFFAESRPGTGKDSPFFEVRDALEALTVAIEKAVSARPGAGNDFSAAGVLIRGPLDYLAGFATREAGSVLQQKWEEMVLADARGIDPHKVAYRVFNRRDGAAWQFLDGPAAPFMRRGKDGFQATTSFGKRVSFSDKFIAFLDQGADGTADVRDVYPVEISTLPVEINEDAGIFPRAVFLTLACDSGPVQLENYNFRASARFDWRMEGCGDTQLTIQLPDTRLRYTYEGDMGFAHFLDDFRHGFRRFTPADFPEQSEMLINKGISWIRVAYRLDNAPPVIDLLKNVPDDVPVTILGRR